MFSSKKVTNDNKYQYPSATSRCIESTLIQAHRQLDGKRAKQGDIFALSTNSMFRLQRSLGNQAATIRSFEGTTTPIKSLCYIQRSTPDIEDCRETMPKNLRQAHTRAIQLASHAVKFFSDVYSIIVRANSIEDINQQLTSQQKRYLFVYWDIVIDPRMRKQKGLSLTPSKEQFSQEIISPIFKILWVYSLIKTGLVNASFSYECEYKDRWWYEGCDDAGNTMAWTLMSGLGDIHFCVDNMSNINDINELALTIIHEASHKFARTTDDDPPHTNAHRYDDLPPF